MRGLARIPPLVAAVLLTVVAGAVSPCPPARAEELFVRLILNSEDKGEILARMEPSGDFLVREADLRAAGFRELPGRIEVIAGEPHVPLSSLPGVRFAFDEKTLTLRVDAPPRMLPKRTIDFLPGRMKNVLYPKDNSAFLNYGLAYATGDRFEFASFNGTAQAGLRARDWLLLGDASYSEAPSDRSFVRLNTSLARDDRETLRRLVLGDAVASTGDLGGSVNIGGIGLSKTYAMDPYLVRYPAANLTGFASVPSEVEVYVDGTRIRTEKIAPGEFELRNIVDYGGAGVVTVVIKDPFGREERIAYPFYFTDALLKEGFHEYEYHAGFLRERFGEESNRYGSAAFSAVHRYGFRDRLTAGVRAEGDREGANAGPAATFRLGSAGVVTASAAGSVRRGGRWGAAGLLRYVYQDRRRSARLSWRGFSRDYAILGADETAGKLRNEFGAGVGYGSRSLGNLSLDFADVRSDGAPDRRTIGLSYSRPLLRRATLLASWRNVREDRTSNELFAGLTYYPARDLSLSASWRNAGGADTQSLQAQKNAPAGEGLGYRVTAERADAGNDSTSTTLNPFVQYNARRAILTGEYRAQAVGGETAESARASVSGGIAYVGGTVGLTRPVNDSFGLAVVDRLEGVRVSVNNQEIGRTDRKGRVFIPNLGSYYENQVSVNDKDIPIDYSLGEVVKVVSPPLRSGSVIRFDAKKIQAVTGRLVLRRDGEDTPLEFREGTLDAPGGAIALPTGKGGEFYLENLAPGAYRGVVEYNGVRCGFRLEMPRSEELIVDLGSLACEEIR